MVIDWTAGYAELIEAQDELSVAIVALRGISRWHGSIFPRLLDFIRLLDLFPRGSLAIYSCSCPFLIKPFTVFFLIFSALFALYPRFDHEAK